MISRGKRLGCAHFLLPSACLCIALHGTRHFSHATRYTSHLTCHTSYITPHASHLAPHKSHVTRHTSHVTRHTSHVTRHTSHVIFQVHQPLNPHAPPLFLPPHFLPPHARLFFPSSSPFLPARRCAWNAAAAVVNCVRAAAARDSIVLCRGLPVCCAGSRAAGAQSTLFRSVLWAIGASESMPHIADVSAAVRCKAALASIAYHS